MIEQPQPCDTTHGKLRALKRHAYPWWLSMATALVLLVFSGVLSHFLLHELPHHRELNKQIVSADEHFSRKNYYQALELYLPLVRKYPQFEKGHMRVVQSCFALSASHETFYTFGLRYMSNYSYTNDEILSLYTFLPTEYHQDFKARLTKSTRTKTRAEK